MKKRLFISSILMTLVLLVAITTATFAWYQANSAGAKVGSIGDTQSGNISTAVVVPTLSEAAVDGVLKIEVTGTMNNLEFAHYNESATNDQKLSSGYIDQNNGWHDVMAPTGSNTFYTTLTIKVYVDDSKAVGGKFTDSNNVEWLVADYISQIANETITVTITAQDLVATSDNSKDGSKTYYDANGAVYAPDTWVKSEAYELSESRARFFANNGNAATNDTTKSITVDIALTNIKVYSTKSTDDTGATAEFKVFIYGGTTSSIETNNSSSFSTGIHLSAVKK